MTISSRSDTDPYYLLCIVCVCVIMSIQPVLAASNDDTYITSPGMTSNIAVTAISVYPETLAPFEYGTITVTIKNIGTSAAQVDSIGIDGKNIIVTNDVEDQRNTIGAGDTRDFTFSFMAPGKEETYYPSLLIQTAKSGYTRYPFSIKVDKAEATISFVNRSVPFNPGIETSIALQVANPRSNDIRAVRIHPIYDQEAFESIVPSAVYIGDLSAGAAFDAIFALTPIYDTTVQFVLEYMNGDNAHEVMYELPILVGQDKKLASPMLSNIVVTNMGTSYQVTGSVSNAGLENANGVVITSKDPAIPVYPDKEYVVGVLKPDDFSRTFTITFEADRNTLSVPIIITYKDNSGNVHEIEYIADLPAPMPLEDEENMPQPAQSGTDHSGLLITIACIVVILAGIVVIYRLVQWKPEKDEI